MNVIIYDPVPTRLQETINALGEGVNVTPVQSVAQLVNIPTYNVVILHEDIDSEWVASVVQNCPHTLVIMGVEKKDIATVRKWTNQIGVHECLSYPMTRDRLGRALQLTGPTTVQSATQYVAVAREATAPAIVPAQSQHTPVQQVQQVQGEQQQASASKQNRFTKPWQQPQQEPQFEEQEMPLQHNSSQEKKGNKKRWIRSSNPEDIVDNLQIIDEEEEHDLSFNPSRQEIVAITSARGGVGKSTISYNLAVMASEMGIRTVIIDNDPRGNMVSISNTKYRYTSDHWDKIDPDQETESTVLNLLARMDCGAYLLPSGAEINGMTSETLEKAIRLLRRSFQLIIIDCEPRFTPATLVAYENANSLLVVTPHDVSTFGRTIEKVKQIRECGVDSDKIHLIINRVEKDFTKDEEIILADRSKCKVIAKVPNTGDIRKLQKQGKPAVSNTKSSFTKQIRTLLSRVILVSSDKAKKKKSSSGGGFLNLFKKSS